MAHVWFADQRTKASLVKPIDELVSNQLDWATEVISDSRVTKLSRRDAVVIYRCTQQDLQSQVNFLREPSDSSLTIQAENAMQIAGLVKSKWTNDRQQSSVKKAGAAFQKSMTTFSQFLESFSGLVEIAKAADQQYGGLAYGTLSLMLSVFVHKTRREQALDEGFEELSNNLPRLITLQRLRQGPSGEGMSFQRLESMIMSTYRLILVFAREATEYYRSKTQRMKDVFRPEEAKNKTMIDIRKALSEIRYECDMVMLTKISSLEQQVGEMMIGVEATRAQSVQTGYQINRARQSSDTRHLADLRQILEIQEPSKYTDLEAYKKLLNDTFFSGDYLRSKHCHARDISMELLRGEGEFDRWWQSSSSSLLLAGGSNFVDDHSSGSLNWLSCGAVHAVEELRRQKRNVAFFLAQTSLRVRTRGNRCSSRTIMATLLYQIAEMHNDLLRGKVDKLRSAVQSQEWSSGDGDAFLLTIRRLFVDIFYAFPPGEEIFIVIDRLDQCKWEGEEDGDSDMEMRHAVETLVRIAVESPCNIKVLLTVDAASSRKLAKAKTALHRKEQKALLLKADWSQMTDDGRQDD